MLEAQCYQSGAISEHSKTTEKAPILSGNSGKQGEYRQIKDSIPCFSGK